MKKNKKIKKSTDENWELLEYELAHTRWTAGTNQRRVGLAFFTAVQGTIFTIIGDRILTLDLESTIISVFGMIVSIISWNHERRIGAHMTGYGNHIKKIEKKHNIGIFQSGRDEAKRQFTFSNRKLFSWYFVLIFIVWILIFTINIFKLYSTD